MTIVNVVTIAAGVCLMVSGACLAVFFATEREGWGRANDATTALFALLLIPAVLEVRSMFTADVGWIGVLTLLCVGGLITIVVTSGLTAFAKLDWKLSATIGAFGFAALLTWMIGTCVLILSFGRLPRFLGWLGIVTSVLVGLAVVVAISAIVRRGSLTGDGQPPAAMSVGAVLAYICFVLWTVLLGFSL